MGNSQIITAAIALVAVIISFLSLYRSGKVQRQQYSLQGKQEELVSLQLEMLRKQAATSDTPAKERADIRVDLEESSRDNYKFVITNWGQGAARNVSFDIKSKEGRTSPLVELDYDEKIPIRELAPGGRISLFAALSFGTGSSFEGRWNWENPDGSEETRSSLLTL